MAATYYRHPLEEIHSARNSQLIYVVFIPRQKYFAFTAVDFCRPISTSNQGEGEGRRMGGLGDL